MTVDDTVSTSPVRDTFILTRRQKVAETTTTKATIPETEVMGNTYTYGRNENTKFAYEDMKITVHEYEHIMTSKTSWLNHNVIDYYMRILNNTVNEKRLEMNKKQMFYFRTAFYTQLTDGDTGYNYEAVKRWYRNLHFEDYGDLFFILHLSDHWASVRICTLSKTIYYMDSMKPSNVVVHKRMHNLESYMIPVTSLGHGWNKVIMNVPQQRNNYDCGVYVCMFAYWTCLLDEVPQFDDIYVADHGKILVASKTALFLDLIDTNRYYFI